MEKKESKLKTGRVLENVLRDTARYLSALDTERRGEKCRPSVGCATPSESEENSRLRRDEMVK